MSNLANYSPYNKTYKFILFQNQAYHERNKRNISPCVRTNLRHSMSRLSPTRTPQKLENNEINESSSPRASEFAESYRSSLFEKRREISQVKLESPKRVVHKHHSFEKFRNKRISQENVEMVSRILQSDCQIIKNQAADRSFKNHLRYENIRRRYNETGQRKDSMPLGQSALLCPTLLEFNNSGLGKSFVEMDLSMSIKPATAQSIRRSQRSQFA